MRGGKRPNTGPKKGSKHTSTLSKEKARELFREVVMQEFRELIAAQLDNAKGIKHLLIRDPKTGKFERVTGSPEQIDAVLRLNSGNAFSIYSKDPSIQAFTDLMNRTLDKPIEPLQVQQDLNVNINLEIRNKIQEALIREQKLIEGEKNEE